jgi:hypothetical protein
MTTDKDDDDSRNSAGDDDEARARKRKERLEQNRISARESRKRKKTMIEELQRTVITLSRENKDLNERNDSLRRQLMEIGAKVSKVCVFASSHCSPKGIEKIVTRTRSRDEAVASRGCAWEDVNTHDWIPFLLSLISHIISSSSYSLPLPYSTPTSCPYKLLSGLLRKGMEAFLQWADSTR